MATPAHPFRPHPLLRGGNAQTLAGAMLPWRRPAYRATQILAPLADGDQLVLHDDQPSGWQPTDPIAVLVHGLGGSFSSPYVLRAAERLNQQGVRAMRLDLRGCGAGERYARGGAHCASWDDLHAALEHVARLAPEAPCHLVGYSMGASLALNLAGELGDAPCGNLRSVMAVCPPLDLHAIDRAFRTGPGRVYSRHFCTMVWKHIQRRLKAMDNPPPVDVSRRPRDIRELDEQITAPFHGYPSVEAYYDHASAGDRLTRVRLPAMVISASDDPVIPIESIRALPRSEWVRLDVTPGGGHLGFVGRRSAGDPDRRWIDWRVVEWVLARSGRPLRTWGAPSTLAGAYAG